MNKLYPIKHDLPGTLWCGPAALSAVTGKPTSVVHNAIQKVSRSTKPVKGVSCRTLESAATELGFKLSPVFNYWAHDFLRVGPKPTLAKFVRESRQVINSDPVIVNVTGHFVVVHGRTFVDNQVGHPVSLRTAPGRRRRVTLAWRVTPLSPALFDIAPSGATLPV